MHHWLIGQRTYLDFLFVLRFSTCWGLVRDSSRSGVQGQAIAFSAYESCHALFKPYSPYATLTVRNPHWCLCGVVYHHLRDRVSSVYEFAESGMHHGRAAPGHRWNCPDT